VAAAQSLSYLPDAECGTKASKKQRQHIALQHAAIAMPVSAYTAV